MNNNAWFKKENPFQTVIGFGGGATGFGAYSSAASKVYVDDVFSTYVYNGNESARNITNNVDLTKGGLVWVKSRNDTHAHQLADTVRGANQIISSDANTADATLANRITAFNSDGFTLGSAGQVNGTNAYNYSSWTFRKQKGFFDIVQYTGNGSARTISHGLGCIPGLIMIKGTSSVNSWYVYHRELGATKYLMLNSTNSDATQSWFMNDTAPTSSVFSLGTSSNVNGSGQEYVAYIFAGGESDAATARSVGFDGSDDYIRTPDHSDLDLDTNQFTIEMWVKSSTDPSSGNMNLVGQWGGNDRGYAVRYSLADQSFNGWGFQYCTNEQGSDVNTINGSTGIDDGQWHHLAVVRESSTIKLYTDGILSSSTSISGSLHITNSERDFYVGSDDSDNRYTGNVSNVRVVVGTALYTSSFKPPTEPLTNVTNTKLLCCNNSSVTGSTVSPGTIYSGGGPTASSNSPFDDPEGFKFGEEGDQNVIKCGSITTDSSNGAILDLPWEPQWFLFKRTDASSNWTILDSMRGWTTDGTVQILSPNLNNAESGGGGYEELKSRTIKFQGYGNNYDFIYMAIRRPDGYVGKLPSAGTDVFAMDTGNASSTIPAFDSGFPVDYIFQKEPASTSDNWYTGSRLTGLTNGSLNLTSAFGSWTDMVWDSNVGVTKNMTSSTQGWMFKRGQGFDVVTWEGTNGNVFRSHNLGKTPEMIIFKNRDAARSWRVYHKGLNGGTNPEDYEVAINSSSAEGANTSYMNGTAPTSTHFVSGNDGDTNGAGDSYIALLFASANDADGNPISKVGSYTGDGTTNGSNTITTGFQPRFVLLRAATTGSNWQIADILLGINAGNDGCIILNKNEAKDQDGASDWIDVTSTGFTVSANNATAYSNVNGETYIYYAHA